MKINKRKSTEHLNGRSIQESAKDIKSIKQPCRIKVSSKQTLIATQTISLIETILGRQINSVWTFDFLRKTTKKR